MVFSNRAGRFAVEAYGVRILIEADDTDISEQIKSVIPFELPGICKFVENEEAEHIFRVSRVENGFYQFDKNGENIFRRLNAADVTKYVGREIRITVAEFAENRVFLHAGVVGYFEKAIVIPASSFRGKTTLVGELIRNGAVYYSDEYAVLDESGLVQPFPKMLSVRGIVDEYTQTYRPVESFGAVVGEKPIPVGLILITEYKKDSENFDVELLSPGRAMLEILKHTISIRSKPEFTLRVLNNLVNRAAVVKNERGEAGKYAEFLLEFFKRELV